MDATSILDQIASEQGWNESSQLTLALNYIENQGSNDAWEDFLKEQATDENFEPDQGYFQDYEAKCPHCGADLTEPEAVDIWLPRSSVPLQTHVGSQGLLVDVQRVIERGEHSNTACAECGGTLEE